MLLTCILTSFFHPLLLDFKPMISCHVTAIMGLFIIQEKQKHKQKKRNIKSRKIYKKKRKIFKSKYTITPDIEKARAEKSSSSLSITAKV